MHFNHKIVLAHVAAWIIYVLILFLGTDKPGLAFWTNTISTIVPIIIFFYLNIALLFPKFLQTRKTFLLISSLIVFNFCTICLRLLLVMFLQGAGIDNFMQSILSPVLFWNQFRVNLLFIGISFAYWYAVKNYRSEKSQQQLKQEILDARLNGLKNQINPHFLYNTLSFIYTKSLPYSTELAGAIAKLSDMMRYSLSDVGIDGKVPLEKEITHINNFIEIQQLRFDNKLKVAFETVGDISQYRAMPLLLITFVENAFKHGKLNDADAPLSIRLHVSGQKMDFEIKNKKARGKKEKAHGIGLENVRNRLGLAYPGQHELTIRDTEEDYFVSLKIKLES
ncbi:MAG: histidine kinase [Ferruginibacter sp.]